MQRDGTLREGEHQKLEENFVWSASARVDSLGYVIEFAIPFTSLKFPSKQPFEIGFNVYPIGRPALTHLRAE